MKCSFTSYLTATLQIQVLSIFIDCYWLLNKNTHYQSLGYLCNPDSGLSLLSSVSGLFLGLFLCHAAAGLEAGSALVSLTVHKKDLTSIFAHQSGHCLFF